MLEEVFGLLFVTIWFYLPAAAANMAPVLVTWIPFEKPIWESKLGKNKTWRGFVVGVIVAIVVVSIQKSFSTFVSISKDFFSTLYENNTFVIGLLVGAGALLGDSVKSFFKRKCGIASGERWWPFDQIDFILGSTVFVSVIFFPGCGVVLFALLLTMFIHPFINKIGFALGLKKVPW